MSDIKISLVVPCVILDKKLEDLALMCVGSYMDQVDEIIITQDSGMFSTNLLTLADSYIYCKENVGFTKNVNRGWKYASGDYVMIVNSDTQLRKGNLKDLCIPGKVTSPVIVNQYIERLAGPFWVVPKEVAAERGYLLEELKTYSSDSEYDHRVKDIFVKVPSVEIYHEQAQTVKALGIEGGAEQERDRKIYEELIKEGKAAH